MKIAIPKISIDIIVYQYYIIPTIKVTYDKILNGNKSIDLIWLKWALSIELENRTRCSHSWKPPFETGYTQCKKCNKIKESSKVLS